MGHKVETFQALWASHDKSEAAFFFSLVLRIIFRHLGMAFDLICFSEPDCVDFCPMSPKRRHLWSCALTKQKDKLGMICSGKNPSVLICVYVILVSLLEPSLPSLDLMIMLSTQSIFYLESTAQT